MLNPWIQAMDKSNSRSSVNQLRHVFLTLVKQNKTEQNKKKKERKSSISGKLKGIYLLVFSSTTKAPNPLFVQFYFQHM